MMSDLDDQERAAMRATEHSPASESFAGTWLAARAYYSDRECREETFTRREVDEIAGLCRHMGYESAEAIIQLREEGRLPFRAREKPRR